MLGRPAATAIADLERIGGQLSVALLGQDALATVTNLVSYTPLGSVVDIVVTTDGAGLALPYELLRLADGRMAVTVAGVRLTRRVRGVARQVPPAPLPGPLKILAAVAAPELTESPPLDVEAEMQAIADVVTDLGEAQVKILEVASPQTIAEALHADSYHVLHLSAHGSPRALEFEDEDGYAVLADAADLVQALRHAEQPLPLIVLSSCSSGAGGDTTLAAQLIQEGADRVIAMQAPVSDAYATRLLRKAYQELAAENTAVAAALAHARTTLYAVDSAAKPPARPEYPVATLLAAVGDPPLCDPLAPPQPLAHPTEPPASGGVRELALGDLIGRRRQLRLTLRALRDDQAVIDEFGVTCGVQLTGIGGIGKTALAGRVIARLREDTPPWAVAVHEGTWNPQTLLAAVAQAVGGTAAKWLLSSEVDDAAKIDLLCGLLGQTRLLLVFDDFEHNLTVGVLGLG
jgi:hypothetical protein